MDEFTLYCCVAICWLLIILGIIIEEKEFIHDALTTGMVLTFMAVAVHKEQKKGE